MGHRVTVDTFRTLYPEFSQVDDVTIQACLNRASLKMGGPDLQIWGALATVGQTQTQADEAQGCLAASLLTSSPLGGPTKMAKGANVKNQYQVRFEELLLAKTCMGVVAGGPRGAGFFPGGRA